MKQQPRINEIVHSIRNCSFTGITRYIFLESKMLELFVLQMEQANSTSNGIQRDKWSGSDRDRLMAVKQYIDNAYLEEFSLKKLVYQFGLNEFKLKKGFKALFNCTVFGYVHQLRMQKAKTLIMANEMNITEAAFFVGYENVSSFCTEFKKKVWLQPGKAASQLEIVETIVIFKSRTRQHSF